MSNVGACCAMVLCGSLLGVVAGCEPPEYRTQWQDAYDVDGPYKAANGAMVYVHRSFGQVIRVQPGEPGGEVSVLGDRLELGGKLTSSLIDEQGETLFVMDATERLHRIDLSDPVQMNVKSVELASAYDKLSLDPQGEFLLLSFSPGESSGTVIARNLNEVGIIDLRGDELEARFITLSTRGQQFVFAPKFELGGESRRLVAALSDSEVTILDLLAEDDANVLREVPLTLSEAEQIKRPVQAIFDVTPEPSLPDTVSLYVLTNRGSDITQVSIQPSARQDATYTFDLSVNQLAAGANPGQMALLELPARGARLMALDRSSAAFTMVDVESGEGATFTLPMARAATQMVVYTASRREGSDETEEVRVLAYSPESPVVTVIRPETISISGDQPTLGQSVEAIRLEKNPLRVEYDADAAANRAVVFHSGFSSGFTILDLEANRDIPIEGFALNDVIFDGSYAYGVLNTRNMVAFELDTGHPTVFDLPYEAEHVTLDASEGLLLLEVNGRDGGFVAFDAEEPTPENAIVREGVFLDETLNLFDDEEEKP